MSHARCANDSRCLAEFHARLMVDVDGTIVDFELNSPFAYLYQLAKGHCSSIDRSNSSKFIALGASPRGAPSERRSSASNFPSKKFESPWPLKSISDVETFLAGLRFENRNLLDTLPSNLVGDNMKRRP